MENKIDNTEKPQHDAKLPVRRSFHSYYAIFEIQDKGIIKMVYPKLENGDEHTFKTREEAIEWIFDYADDFRRYFIMEQITVY